MVKLKLRKSIFLACLTDGDEINFLTNAKEPRTALEQYMSDHSAGMHHGTFKGWFDDKCERMMVASQTRTGIIEGTIRADTTDFYVESDEAEEKFIASRVDDVNNRLAAVIRKSMGIIEKMGAIVGFEDADTVLQDVHDNTETEASGVALAVLDVWEQSTDKKSVEKLFEVLYGLSFTEWMIYAADATTATVRENQKEAGNG